MTNDVCVIPAIIHTYPTGDLRPHVTDRQGECWCHPVVTEYVGGVHILHNSMDRREEYEEGRKPQ